ncbi:MAG: zinc ribbon domain-containing protein, partial [Candidatus Heimdallarchaeota archaeon]
MFCETCGQKNGDQAKFCRYCGSSIENSKDVRVHNVHSPRSSESIGFGSRNTGENLVIRCSLCAGQDFAKDTGRLDSK